MSEVTSIHPADLRTIERNLGSINQNLGMIQNGLEAVDSGVHTVNQNVQVVYSEVGALAKDFREYIEYQARINNLQTARTELIRIRQELKQKYGYYDQVRRTATGILQADDLGIVRQETISNASEELMISAPGYWLAPCLVALAAWISDQPELADRALREGIRRNDEKTSLFFALICRRADRNPAALQWIQRYLANQDEENLDRKTIIILDAFASGLFGADSEGVISQQMNEWLEHLERKPGFVERQTDQWSAAINLKRKPLGDSGYTYLSKYSKTWPVLEDILEGARLHADLLDYFTAIFEQQASTESLKVQMDEILDSLVTDFDDEELPLRKEEKFNQFIIDFDGDVKRARQNMTVEQSAFDTHKDFTQLLTDAAMKPESAHANVSTQKFAIALSKDWIETAYNDVVAQNRMKIPNEIEINLDAFNETTQDGQNEEELLWKWNTLIDRQRAAALSKCVLSGFDQFCLYGGAVIGVLGIVMALFTGHYILGAIALIAGIGMVINHFSKKKQVTATRQKIQNSFHEKRVSGAQIIRATVAEVVDFRAEFQERDSESQKVIDFLEQLSPDQYVRRIANSNRRVKVH